MSLFESGKDNLANEFKELLAKNSQTIAPGVILEVVASNEGTRFFVYSLILLK